MRNNNPEISVIMSVYNGERYLREAIESILNQTFKDFEFIIIDDGSTDRTPEILREYAKKDERIKIITNPKNIGLTKSLNKAIKKAKGEYIARMDADDIAMPERLKKQIEFMEKNPEVGLLGTAYYEMNSKGEIVGDKLFPTSNKKLKKILIKYNPFFHASVMVRKEVFNRVGPYDKNIPKAQDYELWFRIAQNYKIANLSSLLMKRRYSGEKILREENQQLKWATRIRMKYIKKRHYPWWTFLYVIRPFIICKIPSSLRLFLRKKILRKRIYN